MKPEIDLRRVFRAASRMPVGEARHLIAVSCKLIERGDGNASGGNPAAIDAAPTVQSAGAAHYAKREKFINRMHSACNRVLKYAKHETLRNIERHFRANPRAIESAEDPKPGLAARLTFKKPDFTSELLAALREEAEIALGVAGQQLFDELGRGDPFKLPSESATGFLDTRANLLSEVSDEVHAEIMQSIQDGLELGETRRELMARIAPKFDEIYKGRFKTVANTETAAAFNYSRDKAMREAGVTHKKWLHSQSPDIKEPRDTHVDYDGQVRQIDKPFNIGGVKFMYPGDDSLGAGPEDIINCHCVAIAVEKP